MCVLGAVIVCSLPCSAFAAETTPTVITGAVECTVTAPVTLSDATIDALVAALPVSEYPADVLLDDDEKMAALVGCLLLLALLSTSVGYQMTRGA